MSKTHDYATNRHWGHDYSVTSVNGYDISISGWGHGLKKDDFILLQDSYGESTRYKLTEVNYTLDPSDMWFASATFAPRQDKEQ